MGKAVNYSCLPWGGGGEGSEGVTFSSVRNGPRPMPHLTSSRVHS